MNNNSEIKKFKAILALKDSEINDLKLTNANQNEKIQSLERQIVQILSGGDVSVAQRVERLTKDILTFDPDYFEHCNFSNNFDDAIKKV